MSKSKTPDRSKMNAEELRKFKLLFAEASSDLRMEFMCAICSIQVVMYLIKNQKIPSQKIDKWFINEYIQEYLKLDLPINFEHENIIKTYLKNKFLIDFDKYKPIVLNAINEGQRKKKEQVFLTWDKWLEFMINYGYGEKQTQKMYNWITCDKKRWY